MIDASQIKTRALELGFSSVGVCAADPAPHFDAYRRWVERGFHGTMAYMKRQLPLRAEARSLLPSAQSIVAVTLNYNQPCPAQPGKPRIARYALGRDYHKVIRKKLSKLAAWIEAEYSGSETRPCVDSAPILEREYANLAGLGWFGKNTCLIDSKRGSWYFIGLLLTSLPLRPDKPALGGCGRCQACVEACPTGAIVHEDGRWQVDARRCISYLTIEHKGAIDANLESKLGGWTFGCDICQEVCPFNAARESQPERAVVTFESDFLRSKQWPDLENLAQISAEEWDRLSAGSAVRRAGLEGIRRNARASLR